MKNDRPSSRRRFARVVPSLAVLAASAGSAWATPLRPPTPDELQGPSTVLTILVTVVLAGLLLLAAFFPSKRGHQD
ncbi:MAG: hypothetical protein RIB60_01420 [Phycisphaerales bacterium]